MTPPRLSVLLVWLSAPRDARRFVLGDLATEYERLAATAGGREARRWYRRQARSSVAPLLRVRLGAVPRVWAQWTDLVGAGAFVEGARWVRRHAWMSATVVGTLGLAMAACLAAFAVADIAVFRPLPYPEPAALIRVWTTGPTRAPGVRSVSLPDFKDWRDRSQSFSTLAAYAPTTLRLTGRGEPREITATRVSEQFDRVLALPAAAGRYFQEDDFNESDRVAVLTHGFATREFGSASGAIGQTLALDDHAYRVIGVLPDRAVSLPLEHHELWIPLLPRQGAFWETSRASGWLTALGRLREGTTLDRAASELTSIAKALEAEYPDSNRGKVVGSVARVIDDIAGPVAAGLALLGAAVGAVLIIACGNVVNLLLASASIRQREFAVRSAIGASRVRLLGQVLVEHLLLASLAGAIAAALAPSLARVFLSLSAGPRAAAVPVEAGPLLIGAGVAFVLIVAVALTAPIAWRLNATVLVPSLHVRSGASRRDGISRHAFVTLQVAMSVLLIAGGIAFVRTVARLSAVERGFDPARVLTLTATPSPNRYRSGAATLDFYRSIVTAVEQLPGVESAASAVGVPFTSFGWQFGIRPRGAQTDTLVAVNLTTERYFETLGIRLLDGRLLTADEQRSSVPLAIVNEPLARLIAPDRSVVNLQLPYSGRNWTIVGVVEGARQRQLREPPSPELFIPWGQAGQRPQTLVVRAAGMPSALMPSIMATVHAIDPSTPVANVVTLEERLQDARRTEAFRAALLLSLAAVAILLAAFGAYSVTSNAVAARTREYGIRLALGARPGSIQGRALRTIAVPALVGAACGTLIVMGTGSWLSPFLFETDPRHLPTLATVALAVCTVAITAGFRSARRASRTDPLMALRAE